jgi:hypothetical protein
MLLMVFKLLMLIKGKKGQGNGIQVKFGKESSGVVTNGRREAKLSQIIHKHLIKCLLYIYIYIYIFIYKKGRCGSLIIYIALEA